MSFELVVLVLILTSNVTYGLSECSTSTHHFSCHYYYNQLEEAITNDKNELYWLHKSFFPEQLHSPEIVEMTIRITVGNIPLQNCTRNDQHAAFYFDGSQWIREWYFTLSTSAILTFINEDVLLSFDNTITWAIHTMAIGLGATISKENSLGMHIPTLTCMPSMEMMTETLIMLSSRLKAYARYQGIPLIWNEENRMHISTVYVKHKDWTYEVVYKTSRIGSKLLLTGFVLINVLAMLLLVILSIHYYPKLWMAIKDDERNEYSLYWATVFVLIGMNVVLVGVMIIGFLYGNPNLPMCYKREMPCTDHYAIDISLTKLIVTFALTPIVFFMASFFASKDCKEDGSNITGIMNWSVFWGYLAIKKLDTKYFGGKLSTKCSCNSKCSCSKSSRLLQSLALCNILVFLQILASASLPLFLLLFLYPEQVISAVLFILSGTFCLIISVAHVVHLDRYRNQYRNRQNTFWNSHRLQIPIQAFAILLLIALMGVLGAFYIMLLSHGIQYTGIHGFIVTLFPSVTLGAVGYIIKQNGFNLPTKSPTLSNGTCSLTESSNQE